MNLTGYGRVSTQEQADSGAGLAAQRTSVDTGCALRGFTLAAWVEDAGVSGSVPWHQRPALAPVIRELDAGKGPRGLIVAKLDRLSRSVLDFADLMARSRERGWQLICIDLGIDTSTPAGELMANVLASFSQFERRMIGLRTKEALAAKAAAGVRIGRPPRTELTEAERTIAALRAEGHTQTAIVTALNEAGTRSPSGEGGWSLSAVQRALTRAGRISA